MAASKRLVFLATVFSCVLLSCAQDDETWFWIMADSVNSTVACPGRCLAVDDSSKDEYENQPVGFVACKQSDSSSGSSSSTGSNTNQKWLRDNESDPETTIRFNATVDTAISILCLQPDPAASNRTLVVKKCEEGPTTMQRWIVSNNSIASLAFDPPRYLAMTKKLARFLNTSDGPIGWREASFLPTVRPNDSLTTTFSMVDGTQNPDLPPPPPGAGGNEPAESRNFIRNGGFEQSSYDFPNNSAPLTLSDSDIFGLCNWDVMKTDAQLGGGAPPSPPEGFRSLYIHDGIVKQKTATSPGGIYTLLFQIALDTPTTTSDTPQSSGEDTCTGNDTLSVTPYPSTNVQISVNVANKTWTTKHVTFQALGNDLELAFRGCKSCGCHIDDVNLLQVLDKVPFPPPPPRPSPKHGKEPLRPPPEDYRPPIFLEPWNHSDRLSNGAVVGVVVGAAALFFIIGAACSGVLFVKKKDPKQGEVLMARPREWSIHTTTPPLSSHPASSNAPANSAPLSPHVAPATNIAGSFTSSNPSSATVAAAAPNSNPSFSSSNHTRGSVA